MVKQKNGVYRFTCESPLADGIAILLFGGGVITFIAAFGDPFYWVLALSGAAGVIVSVLMYAVFKIQKFIAVVSDEGIIERVSKVSSGMIRWDEIESIGDYESTLGTNSLAIGDRLIGKKDEFVGIVLKDADAHIKKLNFLQKGLMKLVTGTGHAHINIPCNLLRADTEKFVVLCNEFLKKSRER
jgi:hypothetical protein